MQYHLRQSLVSISGLVFLLPEVSITFAKEKFDEATGELKDQAAIDLVKLQLAEFEKFVRRVKV
jgi:NAD(P)H-dependent FMN reductase